MGQQPLMGRRGHIFRAERQRLKFPLNLGVNLKLCKYLLYCYIPNG